MQTGCGDAVLFNWVLETPKTEPLASKPYTRTRGSNPNPANPIQELVFSISKSKNASRRGRSKPPIQGYLSNTVGEGNMSLLGKATFMCYFAHQVPFGSYAKDTTQKHRPTHARVPSISHEFARCQKSPLQRNTKLGSPSPCLLTLSL